MNARPHVLATRFFREHAGYSYDPAKESKAQGRYRCARELASAETWAARKGIAFHWSVDPYQDSSEWSDERPAWKQWQCALIHNGACIASLHGIDFGRDGSPYSDPYARVVQAELADEVRSENRI